MPRMGYLACILTGRPASVGFRGFCKKGWWCRGGVEDAGTAGTLRPYKLIVLRTKSKQRGYAYITAAPLRRQTHVVRILQQSVQSKATKQY